MRIEDNKDMVRLEKFFSKDFDSLETMIVDFLFKKKVLTSISTPWGTPMKELVRKKGMSPKTLCTGLFGNVPAEIQAAFENLLIYSPVSDAEKVAPRPGSHTAFGDAQPTTRLGSISLEGGLTITAQDIENWNIAYALRMQWGGASDGLNPALGRESLELNQYYGQLAEPNTWQDYQEFLSYIGTDNFFDETVGWRMTYGGHLDVRSIFTNELVARAFIADLDLALLSGHMVTKSVTQLSRNFVVPAQFNTGKLYVEAFPGFPESQVFEDSDWIRLQVINRGGGGLIWVAVWGIVVDNSFFDEGDGEQSYDIAIQSVNAAAVGEEVYAGAAAQDFGQSGDGFIQQEAGGTYGNNRPWLQIATWDTNPYDPQNINVRMRLGNITGVIGQPGIQMGFNTSNDREQVFIGDSETSIDWNYLNENKLTIRGGLIQRPSGDPAIQILFRGAYGPAIIYYEGDEVVHNSERWRYTHHTPTSGEEPGVSGYWELNEGPEGPEGPQGPEGPGGTDAQSLSLSATGQIFKYDKDGEPDPINQVITFTAEQSNLGGSFAFTSDPNVTLMGSGAERHLSIDAFANNESVKVTVSRDGLSDYITVHRVVDGSDSVLSFLTNEAHTVPATSGGTVISLVGAESDMIIKKGINNVTADWVFSNDEQIAVDGAAGKIVEGCTAEITTSGANKGRIVVTGVSANVATVTIIATKDGYPNEVKVFTLVLSEKGNPGSSLTNRGTWQPATYYSGDFVFSKGSTEKDGDWYLPTSGLLALMYTNLKASNIGGFEDALYWSSSENDIDTARTRDFTNDTAGTRDKGLYARVRPVRDFVSSNSYPLGTRGPQGGYICHIVSIGGGSFRYYEARWGDITHTTFGPTPSYDFDWANNKTTTGATSTAVDSGLANTGLIIDNSSQGAFSAALQSTNTKTFEIAMWILLGDADYVSSVPPAEDLDNWTVFESIPGQDGKLLRLVATATQFTFNSAGSPVPEFQTITFTANEQGLGGTLYWSVDPAVSMTGSGNIRQLSVQDFGANQSVRVQITKDGHTDYVTVVRVKDGSAGADGGLGPVGGFHGEYDPAETYVGSVHRSDIVFVGDPPVYYRTKPTAGTISGIHPTNTTYWADYGVNAQSIATGLLFAELAFIDNLGVRHLRTSSSGERIHIDGDNNAYNVYDSGNNLSTKITGGGIASLASLTSGINYVYPSVDRSFTQSIGSFSYPMYTGSFSIPSHSGLRGRTYRVRLRYTPNADAEVIDGYTDISMYLYANVSTSDGTAPDPNNIILFLGSMKRDLEGSYDAYIQLPDFRYGSGSYKIYMSVDHEDNSYVGALGSTPGTLRIGGSLSADSRVTYFNSNIRTEIGQDGMYIHHSLNRYFYMNLRPSGGEIDIAGPVKMALHAYDPLDSGRLYYHTVNGKNYVCISNP